MPRPTKPARDGGGICLVFCTKLGRKVTLFGHDQHIVAKYQGRQQEQQHPGQFEDQRNADQRTNAAQVERIPGERKNPGGDKPAGRQPRIGWLAMLRKFPPRPDDEQPAPYHQERTREGNGWVKEAKRKGARDKTLQPERHQQGQAKDYLEDLPPPFVCNV